MPLAGLVALLFRAQRTNSFNNSLRCMAFLQYSFYFSFSGGLHHLCYTLDAGQTLISQAMTSTLAGGGYSDADTDTPVYKAIQRQLLRAAYLGILLGALTTGKKRVLLTAIGGGAFGNPHPLIWESILWAMNELEALPSCSCCSQR